MRITYIKTYISIRKDLLERFHHITNVILFGSVVKGTMNEDSDIDIICIGSKDKTLNNMIELRMFLDDKYPNIDVDLKYYNRDVYDRLLNEGNIFLKSIKNSMWEGEDINELL